MLALLYDLVFSLNMLRSCNTMVPGKSWATCLQMAYHVVCMIYGTVELEEFPKTLSDMVDQLTVILNTRCYFIYVYANFWLAQVLELHDLDVPGAQRQMDGRSMSLAKLR